VRYIHAMGYPTPAVPARRPRSGIATALAVLAGLLGALGVLLLVVGFVGLAQVATPNMQGFNPGQSIDVGDSGMSVYARSDAVRLQAVCTAQGPPGEVVLERPVTAYAVDVAGSAFYEVARSPQDMPAGTYQVTCQGTQDAVYAGPSAPDTTATGLFGPLGLLLGAALLALSLLAALVAFLARGGRPDPARPGAAPSWADREPYAAPPPVGPPYGAPPPAGRPYAAPPGEGQGHPPDDPWSPGYDAYAAPASEHAPSPWPRSPSRYTSPGSDPTEPMPYGQGAYTPPPPPASSAENDESAAEAGDTGPIPSGTGYGTQDEDDTPSNGLGWSPPAEDR
jgi:hypothetical protein